MRQSLCSFEARRHYTILDTRLARPGYMPGCFAPPTDRLDMAWSWRGLPPRPRGFAERAARQPMANLLAAGRGKPVATAAAARPAIAWPDRVPGEPGGTQFARVAPPIIGHRTVSILSLQRHHPDSRPRLRPPTRRQPLRGLSEALQNPDLCRHPAREPPPVISAHGKRETGSAPRLRKNDCWRLRLTVHREPSQQSVAKQTHRRGREALHLPQARQPRAKIIQALTGPPGHVSQPR